MIISKYSLIYTFSILFILIIIIGRIRTSLLIKYYNAQGKKISFDFKNSFLGRLIFNNEDNPKDKYWLKSKENKELSKFTKKINFLGILLVGMILIILIIGVLIRLNYLVML